MSPATQRVILVGGVGSGTSPTFINVTSTGQFLAANGTAAAPSYSFTSDTGTGMYRFSSGTLGFSFAGAAGLSAGAFSSGGYIGGGGTFGGYIGFPSTGSVAVAAAGTSQSITLTPSGTGEVLVSNNTSANLLNLQATGATPFNLQIKRSDLTNAYTQFYFDASGNNIFRQNHATGGFIFQTNATTALTLDSSQNVDFSGTSVTYGASAAASANSGTQFMKTVTAIADNSAIAILTVTIPNAAHSAVLRVDLSASLGAGGAIGANEATGGISYNIAISRTAGVNAVAVASSAFGSSTASVAGAATITVSAVVSAISGAVGASNTFTVNITIARGSGTSTNHTVRIRSLILNANATGITVA